VVLEPGAKALPLGTIFTSDIASPVLAIGHSGSLTPLQNGSIGPPSANVGVLSSIVTFTFHGVDNLIIDAPMDPGDSGGPVLNAEGKVVGMVRAAQITTTSGARVVGTFYAVDIDEIRDSLPKLKRGESR
jgi:S1-C subfamily serine protease